MCGLCNWSITVSRPSQWRELGNMCNLTMDTCTSVVSYLLSICLCWKPLIQADFLNSNPIPQVHFSFLSFCTCDSFLQPWKIRSPNIFIYLLDDDDDDYDLLDQFPLKSVSCCCCHPTIITQVPSSPPWASSIPPHPVPGWLASSNLLPHPSPVLHRSPPYLALLKALDWIIQEEKKKQGGGEGVTF